MRLVDDIAEPPALSVGWSVSVGGAGGGGLVPTFDPLTPVEADRLYYGLYLVDLHQLRGGVRPPTEVRQVRPSAIDHWRTVRELRRYGTGDELAIAAAEAAWQTLRGNPSVPHLPPSAIRGRAWIRPRVGRITLDEAESLLYGLYLVDLLQLDDGIPPISAALHAGRIRYERRDPNERWQSLRGLWRRGYGDCEDLSTAVAAEMSKRGTPARPTIYRVRPGLAHAVTLDTELRMRIDPSRTGGMGKAA